MPDKKITDFPLQETCKTVFPKVLHFREMLHRYPELGWQEYETTRRIREILHDHGIESFSTPMETGGVVDFQFHENRPYLLLRADIDALPITDEKRVSYQSQNSGVCHACGHDVHTAVVVGVALCLQELSEKPPLNVRLVFQPAEEPIPSGAPKMVEAGVLKNVKYALGMHVDPRFPVGTIVLTPGWVNMQSIRLDLTLKGPGGHSSRPQDTADLLWIASRIIQDGYQLVYRTVNLLDSDVILTFTEIEARQGYNVIPRWLTMSGTLRLADAEKKQRFLDKFRRYLHFLAEESGCQIHLKIQEGAPAIYNDPNLTEMLQKNLSRNFEIPVTLNTTYRTPGADDFSYYSQAVPGVMVRFGTSGEEPAPGLHEGLFDVPQEVIRIAMMFFLHQVYHLR